MDQHYFISSKRLHLNACINRIYIIRRYLIPKIPNPIVNDKDEIRAILNVVLFFSKHYNFEEPVNRVKRRLFINEKTKKRKSKNPKINKQIITEVGHFKPIRHIIGIKKCRRDFLKETRQRTLWNLHINEMGSDSRHDDRVYLVNQQQNERNFNYTHQIQIQNIFNNIQNYHPYDNINSNGEFNTISQPIPIAWYSCNNPDCRIEVYQNNTERYENEQIEVQCYPPNDSAGDQNEQMEVQYYPQNNDRDEDIQQMEVQYLERVEANDKITEASVRSVLYIQTLKHIISNHETYNLRS